MLRTNLGVCYQYGQRVVKDYAEAVKWYGKVAEQGDKTAQYNLGRCYFKGEGVSKDYVEASKWFNLALARGNEDAKKALTIVEQGMTPEQIAKAQQLAREFKPRIKLSSDTSVTGKDIPFSSPARNTKY